MEAEPGFQMSIDQVSRFIDRSKEEGYAYRYIVLSGGEPLLWKNLVDGVRLIGEARLTRMFKLFTNGLAIRERTIPKIAELLPYLRVLRVSVYEGNEENIDLLKSSFPDAKNIKFQSQVSRYIPPIFADPIRPVPRSMPAACACRNFSLVGDRAYLCSGAPLVREAMRLPEEDYPYISSDVRGGFLAAFEGIDRESQPFCQYCVSNKKVRKHSRVMEVHC